MKKIIPLLSLALLHPLIYAAGSQESETSLRGRDEGVKYNVVFYGTLESQSGRKYDVEYITWEHRIKDLEVYEMPSEAMYEKVSPTINRLKVNPKMSGARPAGGQLIKNEFNLVDVQKIEVPDSNIIWVYRPDEDQRNCTEKYTRPSLIDDPKSTLYIETAITYKDGKTNHYLAERNVTLYLSEKRRADSQEIDLRMPTQLPAVKVLTIRYRKREEDENKLHNIKKKKQSNDLVNNNKQSKKIKTARSEKEQAQRSSKIAKVS